MSCRDRQRRYIAGGRGGNCLWLVSWAVQVLYLQSIANGIRRVVWAERCAGRVVLVSLTRRDAILAIDCNGGNKLLVRWGQCCGQGSRKAKGATVINRNPLILLVGAIGFEPTTL